MNIKPKVRRLVVQMRMSFRGNTFSSSGAKERETETETDRERERERERETATERERERERERDIDIKREIYIYKEREKPLLGMVRLLVFKRRIPAVSPPAISGRMLF